MKKFFKDLREIIIIWLIGALIFWFLISAMYGMGHTDIKNSPLYNTEQSETRMGIYLDSYY